MKTSLREEKIKPGLQVQVDWGRDGSFYYHGKVIRKLRKNWLVEIEEWNEKRNLASVPPNQMRLDVCFTKDGRLLMNNKEDTQYGHSQEHREYFNTMMTEVTT